MKPLLHVVIAGLVAVCGLSPPAQARAAQAKQTYTLRDTFKPAPALAAVNFDPGRFTATRQGDRITYPSPRPSGNKARDRCVLTWYRARRPRGADADHARPAPAALLLGSLHPRMVIAKMLARGLAYRGVHAFVLTGPGYGDRRAKPGRPAGADELLHAAQAIDDARRARDVIAAMPGVDPKRITLQGTSLGGFFAAVVGAMDRAYDPVVLLLAGGRGADVLIHGHKDAALFHQWFLDHGHSDAEMRRRLATFDPLRFAPRLDPTRTWLVSARYDTVVPRADSDALAKAIGLPPGHRLWLDTNHYTAILKLPAFLDLLTPLAKQNPSGPREDAGAATGH